MSAVKTLLLLLALLCAFHRSPLCEAAVCYVKPTEPHNATCPGEPCYTLDEYVSNSKLLSKYFVSNTVVKFLSGYHNLRHSINIPNVQELTFTPYTKGSAVVIRAMDTQKTVKMHFFQCSDLVLNGLTFVTSSKSHLHLMCESTTNIDLSGLSINSTMIHFSLLDVGGRVTVSDFYANSTNSLVFPLLNVTRSNNIDVSNYGDNDTEIIKIVTINVIGGSNTAGYGLYIALCLPGHRFIISDAVISGWNVGLTIVDSCESPGAATYFEIENTILRNNVFGLSVIPAVKDTLWLPIVSYSGFILNSVSFEHNWMGASIYHIRSITFNNSFFGNSLGSAMYTENSAIRLTGNITFKDNRGYQGGAMSLNGMSSVWLPIPDKTYIVFENNTAEDIGGALYFTAEETRQLASSSYCPFVLGSIPKTDTVIFNFTQNGAQYGGDAIYGGYLVKECVIPQVGVYRPLYDIINPFSDFQPKQESDLSLITSHAAAMCLCRNGTPHCEILDLQRSVHPGEFFNVSAALVSDTYGIVEGAIHAHIGGNAQFSDEGQTHQMSKLRECTSLKYSILTNLPAVNVSFFPFAKYELVDNKLLQNRTLHISLLPCPFGFSLSSENGCVCNKLIQEIHNVHCSFTQQMPTISRKGSTWVGTWGGEHTLAFSTSCEFCNEKRVNVSSINQTSISKDSQDLQCKYNHSGVLCTGCKVNHSLGLGTDKCLHNSHCNGKYVTLTIGYVIAGIALVFFIKIFDLTVTQGTLNGLIFYANIVGTNTAILFYPAAELSGAMKGLLSFFYAFISWINFDVGIEVCSFNGMDFYTKTWLKFIFPAYVWAIVSFIIILSHCSSRASKLFGNNSVHVLATLALLSYAKLLQTIISVFSFAELKLGTGQTVFVWRRDGTIQQFTGKHIPLFVFALAILVLLCFPFTLVLISIQWLQKGTHYRVLCWVAKLKPFFDAFTGPLKDKHRYWLGVLLLVRCLLFLIFFTTNKSTALASTIFIVCSILVFLASIGYVYKKVQLALLELSYILNLGVLAAGSLYVYSKNGNQAALVITSIGIAFVQFVVTVIYHAYVRVYPLIRTLLHRPMHNSSSIQEEDDGSIDDSQSATLTHTSVQVDPVQLPNHELREPLLEFTDS